MKRPLALFGFSLLAVLFAGFAGSLKAAMYITAAVSITAAALVVFTKTVQRQRAVVISLAAFLAVSVFTYNYFAVYKASSAYVGKETSLSGTVGSIPEECSTGFIYTLKNCIIGGTQTDYSVSLYSRIAVSTNAGDTLTVDRVTIEEADKFSTSEYTDISYGIYLSASVYDDSVKVIPNDNPGVFMKLVNMRTKIIANIVQYYGEEKGGVLCALILGETAQASDEIKNSFRISGLSHLFAVSGLHLTLWSGLIYKLFGVFHKRQRLQSLAAAMFVLFFMALTLFTPSVCRAGIMLIVIYLANIVRKDADSLNSLGLAVAILLCINPFFAANPSFLLSVFATFSIITVYPPVEEYLTNITERIKAKPLRKLVAGASKSLALCIVVTLVLIPFSAYFFGYTSFVAPLANLLCVYPAEAAMITGAFGFLISLIFPQAAFPITQANGWLIGFLIDITNRLSALPFALFSLNTPFAAPWFIVSATVTGLYLIISKHKRKTFYIVLASVCALLLTADVYYYINRNDVTLSFSNSEKSSFAVLTNGYEDKVYISCSESTASGKQIQAHYRQSGYPKCDMLIFLAEETGKNSRASSLISKLYPSAAVCRTAANITVYNDETKLIPTADACFEIWNGVEIRCTYSETFSGVVVSAGESEVLICESGCTVPPEYSDIHKIYSDTTDKDVVLTLR